MSQRSTFALLMDDEREMRRQLILDATIKMLSQHPFVEVGMREIAAAVGVSPAAIYRYFPSRNDLLVEALVRQMNMIAEEFYRKMDDNPMSLDVFAEFVVDHLADNEATFQMMTYLMVVGQMSDRVMEKYNDVMRRFLGEFRRVMALNGIHEDLKILSQTFFSSLVGIALAYRNYPGRSREEIRRHMKRHAHIVTEMFKHRLPRN